MKYLSVCSGIEAATVAWHPLGWQAVAFSEIEPFPCKVLEHHYPTVPNLGDMTKFKEWNLESNVDVFVGGTPCQSFSVAGLRKGLDDHRGNLMLVYLAIAQRYRPNWLVWENVPGVLSSNGGRDFGSLLGGLAECGYGFAYRVLDAQYFGVAQRRRRVFVVGYLGDWRPAAAVLFERHSLQGHPAPSRKARESATASIASGAPISDYDVAGTLDKGTPGRGIGHNGNYDSQVVSVGSLCARTGQSTSVQDAEQGHLLATQPIPIDMMNIRGRPSDDGRANRIGRGYGEVGDPMFTITKANHHGVVQPIAFSGQMSNPQTDVDMTQTLGAKNPMAVAVGTDCYNGTITGEISMTLKRGDGNPAINQPTVLQAMAVRRLTPVECERLQGFPDKYTDIQPKGKATPDGPRYKALGNSMAVPVMAWIGRRIQEVDRL
jgi:DNA (cytosine-5)-methyltransferase 1